ncbi:hypothetical protein Tco_1075919 [Tanacetum coccineum]
MDEDQAGLDPRISRVALTGPVPEPTHDEFMTDLYPKVHESLKFSTDEHVLLEDPLSSTGTLSSMKNLEDAYAIGDQFINDKSTNDEPGKLNVEVEMVSMVNVPIYQASSSVPPLSTPVIDLSPPKHVSSTTQAPILTETTMTTTTPLPPPPQQQSITEYELAECVAALEKKLSDLEQTNKNLDNTTWNLGSRVYTLELRDLPHKIDEAVRENVKEAVQIALQAPLRDRFRDLPEEDMKECFTKEYPPPPPDSDLSKRRRHDTSASGSSQPPAPQSSAWKKSDTRDAPSSSSKQQSGPHAEKPPIPDDERPSTPEHAWVIPPSHIPDAVNNWANALATTYQAPAENSLLEKTGDMQTFMHWYCQKMGKTELTQADLKGQAYEVVKAFYSNVVQLQFQMEECHKMLTDQIDWGSGQALSISKMKAAHHLNFGLELLVPEHMWINEVYTYDISASYEKDFKNLYPSDFEYLNLLLLQGHLNNLFGSNKRMLSTVVNLWTRNLVIRKRVEDFKLGIESYQKQQNLTKPG